MLKIYYTHQKKKNKFPPKKNVWCSRKSMRKRNHFFKRNNILHPPEKTNFPPEKNSYTYLKKKSDEIISHSSLKKPKFHRKRISYTTTENPTFQPKKIIIFSRKRMKKYLIFVRKKLEVSYIYPHPHTPPTPRPSPRKKTICHTKKIEYTSF